MTTTQIRHSDIDSRHAETLIATWSALVDKKARKKNTPARLYQENSEVMARETVLDILRDGVRKIRYSARKDDLMRLDVESGMIPAERMAFFGALCGYAYLWGIRLNLHIVEEKGKFAHVVFAAKDWAPGRERTVQNFQWRSDYFKAKETVESEIEEDGEESIEITPCPESEVMPGD